MCRRRAAHVFCRLVEQRQLAERQRVRGNELFKQKRYSEAYQCYEIGLDAERHSMTLHANAAMASLKLQCWIQAIEHCDKVLHRPEGFLALHEARVYRCHAKCHDMSSIAIAVPEGYPIGCCSLQLLTVSCAGAACGRIPSQQAQGSSLCKGSAEASCGPQGGALKTQNYWSSCVMKLQAELT